MFRRIVTTLWGQLSNDELKKYSLLALGMMLLIGSYWPLRTLKDSIFLNVVGPTHLPMVKIVSLCFFFPLILGYSRLLDYFSREKMIYLLVGLFIIGGVVSSYYVAHPTIGVANDVPNAWRVFGWVFYLYVESYASLLISLYWSYINDITTPESAKKGYGLITFASQTGGLIAILVGWYMAQDTAAYVSSARFTLLFSMVLLASLTGVVFLLGRIVSSDVLAGYKQKEATIKTKSSVGFVDGIKMIFVSPYVAGILGLILSSDIFDVIMSFQLNYLVKTTYVVGGVVNKFLFGYSVIIQMCACLIGLVGTSSLHRFLGIRNCLILYPVLLAVACGAYLVYPGLWIIAGLMVLAKSLSYAFNQPTKEILYIPTSQVVRYKSKAWMDMFGKRLGKASGSVVNQFLGSMPPVISVIGITLTLGWIGLASVMGSTFVTATKKNKIIS